MTRRALATILYLSLLSFPFSIFAQNESPEVLGDKPAKPAVEAAKEKPAPAKEEPPVVTHHQITVGGKVLHYTAT